MGLLLAYVLLVAISVPVGALVGRCCPWSALAWPLAALWYPLLFLSLGRLPPDEFLLWATLLCAPAGLAGCHLARRQRR